MMLFCVLICWALCCSQCLAQPVAPQDGLAGADVNTLVLMIEQLQTSMAQQKEQMEHLEQKFDRLENMIQFESSALLRQESFTKINNLTKEMCSQITEQQCLQSDDFDQLFSQLDDEVTHMKNITLKQMSIPECQTVVDNDFMEEKFQKVEGSMQDLKSVILPSDCAGHLARGARTSGVYEIQVNGKELSAFCDMHTDGGGWTVFQRRQDGFVDFDKTWTEYENGFGYPHEEFWLGNKALHGMTNSGHYILRLDLNTSSSSGFAQYSSFKIGSASEKYKLTIGTYSGNTADSFRPGSNTYTQNGMKFTTKDADNDNYSSGICAVSYGAWWWNHCGAYTRINNAWGSLYWSSWTSQALTFVEMKIRPA